MRIVKECLKAVARRTPLLGRVVSDREHLRAAQGCYALGHYYSPIPSAADVEMRAPAFYEKRKHKAIPGVDLNEAAQLALLAEFKRLHDEQCWVGPARGAVRYRRDNQSYGIADAILLYCMIRHLRPKRIIEVGCGNSSCIILDTNERFLDNSISCTFVDPYPDRLFSLIRAEDRACHEIVPRKLQDIEIARFSELSCGDMLVIDSSHVSKLGSDVNHLFFEILPRLKPGVIIHIHDIFYPFDYPKSWLDRGMYFNEAYVLKAFLQFNPAFEILFWNQFLHCFHLDRLRADMSLCAEDPGAAIWLRRV